MSKIRNETGLSDEEALEIVEGMLEENSLAVRLELVGHFARWAVEKGKGAEVAQVSRELKEVVAAVFRAKPGLDERVALLALDYITDSFAIGVAKNHASCISIEDLPREKGEVN